MNQYGIFCEAVKSFTFLEEENGDFGKSAYFRLNGALKRLGSGGILSPGVENGLYHGGDAGEGVNAKHFGADECHNATATKGVGDKLGD